MSTLETNLIQPSTGTTLTVGASGDTITFPSGATVSGAGANTPGFSAYLGSDQSGISDATWTKINMNTEFFDSDGKYDTSNYRFTPNVAGKYLINARISPYVAGVKFRAGFVAVYKNGSSVGQFGMSGDTTYIDYMLQPINQIVTANGSGDYFEIYGKITTSDDSNGQFSSGANTQLSAFKIIE